MHRTRAVGLGITAFALVGYAIGVVAAYPGRSVSLVGLMVGVTLYAIGHDGGEAP
ncbi:hypothetical protein [Halobellus salinisoli]|uniref:hypothetical protein n=1 Tax=Halobellus salinisoli TaxID=3108500 RepID=UPI00300901D2